MDIFFFLLTPVENDFDTFIGTWASIGGIASIKEV